MFSNLETYCGMEFIYCTCALMQFAPEKFCEIMKIMEHRYGGKDFVTNKDISLLLPGTFYLTEVDSKYRRFYAQKDGAENGVVANGH